VSVLRNFVQFANSIHARGTDMIKRGGGTSRAVTHCSTLPEKNDKTQVTP